MSVARVTELISASTKSFEDAIQVGVSRAVKTLKNVEGVWVDNQKCVIKKGKIAEYRVNLKVTFILQDWPSGQLQRDCCSDFKGRDMTLTSGQSFSYDFNRMVILFTMKDDQTDVPCAISTAAMDDLDRTSGAKSPLQREEQFLRLRGLIEARAAIPGGRTGGKSSRTGSS
jgi:dodecin